MNPQTRPWTSHPLAGFDIESTSKEPLTAQIVTASLLTIDGSTVTPRNWLLNPETEIPADASAIHGITTEHARAHGQDYRTGYREIRNALERSWRDDRIVAIFNAGYDLTVLDAEGTRLGHRSLAVGAVVDPFVIDREVDKYRPGKRTLTATCAQYGITVGNAHSADADALAAARLAWKLGRRYPFTVGSLTTTELMAAQANWHRARQDDFAAYLARTGGDAASVCGDWPVRQAVSR